MHFQDDILWYMQNAAVHPPLILPASVWGNIYTLTAPCGSETDPELPKGLKA